ncbi:MAG TPA: TetR family transcriptional regulator [Acidimicrobiia bacterium]|nr:TetR family transcriptional regulator [Acidimicrobiia bacterium]
MDASVNGLPGRRERKARATRRRILGAAEARFVRDGYVSTTMAAVAADADVAVQTVYAVFGTKRAILTELLAIRTVGDEETTPLTQRAQWQAMEDETDPRRQLVLFAALATSIGERMADLYEVMSGAAGSDPEIAATYDRQQQLRYRDQRRLARALARAGALRPGLSEDRATDILWAIANPRTYHSLARSRGWTREEYQRWLGELLIGALLADPAS